MLRRSRTTICREGWYFLVITAIVFAGAIAKEINLLLLLSGMMMGLLIFHWQVLFVSLAGMKLKRKAPQALCAGDLLAVSLRLSNTRAHFGSWAIKVEDQIEREPNASNVGRGPAWQQSRRNHDKAINTGVLFPYIPPGEERTGGYRGRLVERGRYRLGPLRISSEFPFGLFNRKLTLHQSETIYVYPRLGQLTRRWLGRHRQALAGADRRQRRPGPEGDFYGVREWQSGDSLRLIHWRSSARTGKLVARQFEQPHNRDAAVLLDLWLSDSPSEAELENVELAVSFAATVLADLCRQGGGNVSLGVLDGEPVCLGGPASAALLQDMMKTLAVVEALGGDRLAELMGHVLSEVAPGTEIVVVSTRPADLTDSKRFAAVWSNPAFHAAARRMRSIDASSKELEEFFTAE
jgi:uncharacterized protein (DUF58 family)